MMHVYKITNTVNNKIYIGKTSRSIDERKYEHFYLLKCNKHPNRHLQGSYLKYGNKNFEYSIICRRDNEYELNEAEKYYINFYKLHNEILYNFTDGGDGSTGYKFTPEQKMRVSLSITGNKNGFWGKHHTKESKEKNRIKHIGKCTGRGIDHPMYGKKHNEETRKKISIAGKGRKFTQEHKIKISMALKGKQKHNVGKIYSEEHRRKIREGIRKYFDNKKRIKDE